MKSLKILIVIAIVVTINSCSVLSKSQITNINAFATTAEKYAAFPSEVPRQRASLFLHERLVEVINISDAGRVNLGINKAIDNYKKLIISSDKFDLSLLLIQQYASLLTKLSANNFVDNLSSNTNSLNDNLGNLVKIANTKMTNPIPATVSDAITKVIFLVGQRLTMNKQAKALKEFIPEGQKLIVITMQNIEEAMVTMQDLLEQDKTKFTDTYTANVFMNVAKMNYLSVNQYVTGLSDFDNLELLRLQSISAARKLSKAHAKLEKSILKKSDLKEIYAETQDFIMSMQDLYKTYGKLSNSIKKEPKN